MVDVPALAGALSRELHDAGVPGTPERAVRFARALALSPPATRDELYWTARVLFVSAPEQLAAFDAVFGAIFDGLTDVAESRGDPNAPPIGAVEAGPRPPGAGRKVENGASAPAPLPGCGDSAGGEDEQGSDGEGAVIAAASSEERLHEKSFDRLDANELRSLQELMRRLALAPPPRRSRRLRADRRGERLDLRATLRASRRTGGDPIHLARRRRRMRPRPLVVLCDISGSMEPYSRAFIQFLHGTVVGGRAEAFVFATRLTRITRALSERQPQLAIDHAAASAPDWSGGTRIGRALQEFNDSYGRRGMARGAVVVIVSDGWERENPELVAREMERMRRLAYRIVWVNPRKASPGFAPLAGGMAAALPFCDAFLSGHSLSALHAVADAIGASRAAATSQTK
ncbi:MAG: VWA domain-containing protein [Actinomycetota bacterium]|nr:VWA domain-containing protein [Actinomycetota bacterium]